MITQQSLSLSDRVRAHVAIARFDHIGKNVFVLPGVIVAASAVGGHLNWAEFGRNLVLGLIACTLVACSNYVINEVLDAPYDRFHPSKRNRPVPSGRVHIGAAYVQWIAMMLTGLAVASQISTEFTIVCAALWVMGCIYNIKPLRFKEVPYLDVLCESVNNPLRMLMGWYIVTNRIVPPVSLLASYWMIGAYFMALKRFSEYRQIGDPAKAATYRKSFQYYTEHNLLVSVMFYGSTAMLFFGAFIARYRLELVLTFPLLALTMAAYLLLSFDDDSAVQRPEYLHRESRLMWPVIAFATVSSLLMFFDVPLVHRMFMPSAFERPSLSITNLHRK